MTNTSQRQSTGVFGSRWPYGKQSRNVGVIQHGLTVTEDEADIFRISNLIHK